LHFQISRPDQGWPPGKYKLDLFIDGRKAGSAPFTVGKGARRPDRPGKRPPTGTQEAPPARWTWDPYKKIRNGFGPSPFTWAPTMIWTPMPSKTLRKWKGLPEEGVECLVLVDRAKGAKTQGDDRTDRVLRIKRHVGKGAQSEVLARLPARSTLLTPGSCKPFSPR
jgi:hypothetical protein